MMAAERQVISVAGPQSQKDPWRIPTLGLWMILFVVGLMPEPVFFALRGAGGVVSQHALINSPYMVTVVLAAWVMLFSFYACTKSGLTVFEAQDRALQLAVVALIAFLPVDLTSLLTAYSNPLMRARFTLYLAGLTKLLAWWYLLGMVVRYYLFRMHNIFANVPSLFPSAYLKSEDRTDNKKLEAGDGAPNSRSKDEGE